MAAFPRVCWTLALNTPQEFLAAARRVRGSSSRFVEARLDYLAEPERSAEVIRGLRRAGLQCIATLRSTSAGGRFGGAIEEQLRILAESAQAGATIVDLEVESAESAGPKAVKKLGAKLLLSFHDYRETPESLSRVLHRLKVFPADFYKVVAFSSRHRDNSRLLALNKPRGKVLAFALGEVGAPSRVLSVARGAPFTYGALSAAEAVAPGQLTGTELLDRYRVSKLSGRTAVFGVIGNPIIHSASPAAHNAAFAAIRREAVYLPFRVESLEDFLRTVGAYRLAGFSVTIPHKEAMARAADWIDPEARDVGAINTIVVRGGKLRGYNTDLAGIAVPLEKRMRLRGARVLVAGTGGAARAAAFALARRNAKVIVVGRRLEQAAALAEQVAGETIERNLLSGESFDAIVHATPLGMYPDAESCFFSPGELNAPLLFETVYNPLETRLGRMARARRIRVIPGIEMFLEQAARQFELWTGRKAPRAAMQRAVIESLT